MEENIISLYKTFPPFMNFSAGYGFQGVLLHDTVKNKIQCHFCGNWYQNLDGHIWQKHDMSSREYKKEAGLNLGVGLQIPSLTLNNSQNGKIMYEKNKSNMSPITKRGQFKKGQNSPEGMRKNNAATMQKRNASQTCPAQLKHRFEILMGKLGRLPTSTEVKNKIHLSPYFDSYNSALLAWGYNPRKIVKPYAFYKRKNRSHWTENELIVTLINFHEKFGREPFTYDAKAKLIPSTNNFVKYFGSFIEAKKRAKII